MLELFATFFKIGLFTFGGGYAMLAMIENICVDNKKWLSHDDMMNVTVLAESTPGPIAINLATYVGFKQAGLIGAVITTLGIVCPSFIIIYIISLYLNQFLDIEWIAHAFLGIKIAVGILIFNAAKTMITKMPAKKLHRTIMVCSCVCMLFIEVFALNFSSMTLMLVAAFVSLCIGGCVK